MAKTGIKLVFEMFDMSFFKTLGTFRSKTLRHDGPGSSTGGPSHAASCGSRVLGRVGGRNSPLAQVIQTGRLLMIPYHPCISMYDILHLHLIFMVNAGRDTIHGYYGDDFC